MGMDNETLEPLTTSVNMIKETDSHFNGLSKRNLSTSDIMKKN